MVVSAGGVVYRRRPTGFDVALISVGDPPRWQLPKGKLDPEESVDKAALREVREEAGLTAAIVEHLDTIEYWFQQGRGARGVRFHKRVTFYLMRYLSGDVRDHDDEVHEARWVPLDLAIPVLHFSSERRVVETARERLIQSTAAPLPGSPRSGRPTRAPRPRPARRDAPA